MNIVFIIAGLGRGGAETQIIRLTEGFMQKGDRVKVISLLPDNTFAERIRANGLDVEFYDFRSAAKILGHMMQIHRVLKAFQPDVLIGFMFHGIMLARVLGLLLGKPVVSSIRNEKGQGLKDDILKWTDGLSHCTVVNALKTRENLLSGNISPDHKITLINNAMDSRFLDAAQNTSYAPQESFVWAGVGRLIEAKGFEHLIQALAQLPNARLVLAGGGNREQDLKNLAVQLGVSDRIEFLGIQDDVLKVLEKTDGFVLSSLWEGMPNALLEAMALGKPCVSTVVGGVKDLNPGGNKLLLVSPGNAQELSEAMQKIMAMSEEQRKSMGQQAHALIKEEFGGERIVQNWDKVIRSAIDVRRK